MQPAISIWHSSGVLVGMVFFRTCFFCNDGGTPTTLATQFLNGAGAVAGAGIIQLENVFFFQSVRTQDVSKTIFAAAWVKLRMAIGATRPREIQK